MTVKPLPPGESLPPLLSPGDAKPMPTRHKTKAARKTHRRGSGRHSVKFQLLNSFADVRMRDKTRAEIGVWLALWRDTKPDGTASTGVADLARRVGADRRTILRALKGLTDEGLVEVVHRGGIGRGVNRYRLRLQ